MSTPARTLWSVAWRHTRRSMGVHRTLNGMPGLLRLATHELWGQPLPMPWREVGFDCWVSRQYRDVGLHCAEARNRRLAKLLQGRPAPLNSGP